MEAKIYRRAGDSLILVAIALLVLGIFGCARAFGQVTPANSTPPPGPNAGNTAPQNISNTFQIKPQTLTTSSAVDLCSLAGGPPCGTDVYVCWMDASTGATPTTITMADKQGSPVTRPNAVAIAANTWYAPFGAGEALSQACVGVWYPGGLKITAGNANALTIYIRGKWWSGPALF